MQRKIALFLVIVLTFALCLTSCGQQDQMMKTDQEPTYDKMHGLYTKELEDNTFIHEELTEVLPDLKELVRNALVEDDFLDWKQFSAITEIREFKNSTPTEDFSETTAFYAAGLHVIVVCPKFFEIENGDQRTYALIHELLHSLVGIGKTGQEEAIHLFIEGITDYLAGLVLTRVGLECDLTYQNELYCIAWLSALYGADNITRIICNGNILVFVDEQSKKNGTGARLHNALATLDKSKNREEVKRAILTEIDILTMISGQNNEVCEHYTGVFKEVYSPYLK